MAALETLQALIVDDHEPTRDLLVRTLRRAGAAHVREASCAAEAQALLQQTPADLIVADRRMPGMDGLDFVSAVRAEPRWAHARILVLTADVGAEAAAKRAGADAVLVKPAPPSEVLRAVEEIFAAG